LGKADKSGSSPKNLRQCDRADHPEVFELVLPEIKYFLSGEQSKPDNTAPV